jgi:hypothetical protein
MIAELLTMNLADVAASNLASIAVNPFLVLPRPSIAPPLVIDMSS